MKARFYDIKLRARACTFNGLKVLGQKHAEKGALHLVGTGTSVSPESRTAGASLTNAMMGLSKKSTSPTSTLDASAPEGIFLMKFMSTY